MLPVLIWAALQPGWTSWRRLPPTLRLRQLADNPKVTRTSAGVDCQRASGFTGNGAELPARCSIENGRMLALPEMAAQFHVLVNQAAAALGCRGAQRVCAWMLPPCPSLTAALEKRFGRKLNLSVQTDRVAHRRHSRGGGRRGARYLRQGPSGTNESGPHCLIGMGFGLNKEGKSHATQSSRNF